MKHSLIKKNMALLMAFMMFFSVTLGVQLFAYADISEPLDGQILSVTSPADAVVDHAALTVKATVTQPVLTVDITVKATETAGSGSDWKLYRDELCQNEISKVMTLVSGENIAYIKTSYWHDMTNIDFVYILTVNYIEGDEPPIIIGETNQEKAESIVSQMTFREKFGQMLALDVRSWGGTDMRVLTPGARDLIADYDLGGICLFGGNVSGTVTQIVELTHAMQRTAVENNRFNIPMLLSIDQEGGYIVRLDHTKATIMPGNMAVGATWNPEMAYKAAYVIGTEMAALGVNINFAPSVDVNSNPANPVIGVRSFGDHPEMVGKMGVEYVKGITDAGIIASAKHYPGHGNTSGDTHYLMTVVPGTKEELLKTDLVPFKAAIDAGIPMIMTAHVTVPGLDDTVIARTRPGTGLQEFVVPATLSKKINTDLLRDELGFEGLLVTDAMNMAALNNNFYPADMVEMAIMAGVDLPLMPVTAQSAANVTNNVAPLYAEMEIRANANPALMARVNESAIRILKYKMDLGFYDPGAGVNQPPLKTPLAEMIETANATLRSAEHLEIEREVSKASIVLGVNEMIQGKPVLPFSLKEGDSIYLIQTTDYVNVTLFRNAVNDYLEKVGLAGKVSVLSESFGPGATAFTNTHRTNIDNATFVIISYPVVDSGSLIPDGSTSGTRGYATRLLEVWDYIKEKGYGNKTTGISTMLPYELSFMPYVSALVHAPSRHLANAIRDNRGLPIYYFAIEAIFGDFAPTGKYPVSVPHPTNEGEFIRRAGDGLTYGLPPVIIEGDTSQEKAESIVSQMTFEEKMGQLVFPRAAARVTMTAGDRTAIENNNLGGICLFAADIAGTMDQMIELTHGMQEAAIRASRFHIPLGLSIDLEGGNVFRYGAGSTTAFLGTTMPGNMALGAADDPDLAYRVGQVIGREALAGGFNMNLAPTLDVNANPANPVIGVRSIGSSPQLVSRIGVALAKGMEDTGVFSSIKHFPGHGNTASDTHLAGVSLVPGDEAFLLANDLVPFKAAIDNGTAMVMTAHVTVPETDGSFIQGTRPITAGGTDFRTFNPPATLSYKILTEILREKLGFDGLIITDALDMSAITQNFFRADAVALTIMAGTDIPLIPGNTSFTDASLSGLIAEMKEKAQVDSALMARINESATRLIKYKIDFGIYDPDAGADQPILMKTLEEKKAEAAAIIRSPEHLAVEKEASEKAITLAINEDINGKAVLPFELKSGDRVYVLTSNNAEGRVSTLVRAVNRVAADAGLTGVTVTSGEYTDTAGTGFTAAHRAAIDAADYVLVGSLVNTASNRNPANGRSVNLIAIWNYIKDKGFESKAATISLGLPYELSFLDNCTALLNINARANTNIANHAQPEFPVPIYLSAIQAVFGQISPTGKYPVDVPLWNSDALVRRVGDGLRYTDPITSIRIDSLSIATVARYETRKFSLILNEGATGKNVKWTIADPSLGYVDAEGNVTIFDKTGNVRLTVTDPDSGLSHSITLRIAS